MGIRIHVTDPASAYHPEKQRTGWHDLYGNAADALNGNISRVFLTNIPQSIKSTNYTQETDYCCGPSSIAIALGMSNDSEPHRWLESRGLMTSAWGTEYRGIVQYLNAKGYTCSYDSIAHDDQMSGQFLKDIEKCLQTGYKVILCMHHSRSNYWTNGGHYIVVDAIESGADKIKVDGHWGKDTTKKAQSIFTPNCTDGIISNQDARSKDCWENCSFASWEWVAPNKINKGSQLIREIQKKIGAKVDGFAGIETCKALQKFLSVKADGRFGINSVKAFQKWLNTF